MTKNRRRIALWFVRWNCPAEEHWKCPFGRITICDDVTWKDWQEFFAKDGKHDVDK